MNTTTLFVELLIIGFQTCFWLALLIRLVIGSCHFNWLLQFAEKFSGYSLLVATIVLAVAYTLGVAMDKVAHWLIGYERLLKLLGRFESDSFKPKGWLEAKEKFEDELADESHPLMIHAQVISNTADMTGDLLYARSKVRILRASVLNVPLITLTAVLLIPRSNVSVWWVALILSLALTLLFALTYLFTTHLYNLRLRRFKHYLEGPKDASTLQTTDESERQ